MSRWLRAAQSSDSLPLAVSANSANSSVRTEVERGISLAPGPIGTNGTIGSRRSDSRDKLAAFKERAAIIEYEGGIPRDWAEGFASLDEACPPADIHPARWAQILDDGGMFIDQWAAKAASLSWTAVDVFGISPVKPEARFDRMGLVALLKGRPVVAITEDSARIKTETGHQTYQRTKMQGAQTVWEVT